MKKINRYGHAGKSWNEKEAYKNFLASKFDLDKTENDSVDTNKTDESSFEEEQTDVPETQKKSKFLVIKDFFQSNLSIAIISGIIVSIAILVITGYTSINREQGIQGEKISTIEKNVEKITEDNDSTGNDIERLREDFGIFKAQISEVLDFVKKKINY